LEQKKKQNGGQNQDGREALIFHKLSKFLCKLIETRDLERMFYKKNIVEVTFFQTSKWRIKSRWRQQLLFFSFGSYAVISQPILKCKPILNLS
jgi:hypothetical protein